MKKRPKEKRTNFSDSIINIRDSFDVYYNALTEIALSSFKYENMPPEIDERYLEMCLFRNGKGIFFKDDVLGLITLDCVANSSFNMYGEPKVREAYSMYSNYRKKLTEENSVIIWNNKMRTNSIYVVEYFAKKLANIDVTIDINVNGQKTPILLQGTEKQKMTLINMYKSYTGNEPLICGYDGLDVSTAMKSIPTLSPYVSDKLTDLKNEIWKQALSFLGVGVSSDKRERMISGEIGLVQGEAFANRQSKLESRKKAIEKVNRMFGTEITVEFNDSVIEMAERGVLNGEVHNDVENDM